jgi:hypothetical protein
LLHGDQERDEAVGDQAVNFLYWHAFPIQRNGYRYHRFVWKLFGKNGIPIWFWDCYGEPL